MRKDFVLLVLLGTLLVLFVVNDCPPLDREGFFFILKLFTVIDYLITTINHYNFVIIVIILIFVMLSK